MKEVFSLATPLHLPKFEEKLESVLSSLPRLEAQVAQYMLLNIGDLSFETGASISEKVGVSEVTVSRLLRKLGYQGMRGLKRELREELLRREEIVKEGQEHRFMSDTMARNMDRELRALREVYQQITTPMWQQLVKTVVDADEIYVTGFQAVRGMAQDCAKRLEMTRRNVRFIAANDSMLVEWLDWDKDSSRRPTKCLILIDVVPYAKEASILAKLCNKEDFAIIIFTDEMCHWAKNYTDNVVYASTRTGLTLESTVAISAALNLMVNAVAEQYSQTLPKRLEEWKSYTRALKLF